MEIVKNFGSTSITFENVCVGEVFSYDDEFFIKIKKDDGPTEDNAFCVDDGCAACFLKGDFVIPFKSKLIIS